MDDEQIKRETREGAREERSAVIAGIKAMTSADIYAAHSLYKQLLASLKLPDDQEAMLMAGACLISAVWNGALVED